MISLRGGGIVMNKFSSQQPTVDLEQVIPIDVKEEGVITDINASIAYILENYKQTKTLKSQLLREFRKLIQLDLETEKIQLDINYVEEVKQWIQQLLPLVQYLIIADGDICLQLVDYISALFKTLYLFYTFHKDKSLESDYQESIIELVSKQKKQVEDKYNQNQKQKYVFQFVMIEFQIFEEVLQVSRKTKAEAKQLAISIVTEGFKSAIKLEVSDELIDQLKESFFLLAKATQNELKELKLDIILKIIRQTKVKILKAQQGLIEQKDIEDIKNNLIKLHKTVQESENWQIRFCWIKMIGELINYRDTSNIEFKKLQLQLLNGDGQGLNNFVSYSNNNFKTLQVRNSDDEPLLLSFINEFYRFDYKEQILRLVNFFQNTPENMNQKFKEVEALTLNEGKNLENHQFKLKEFHKYFRQVQQQLQLVSEITTYVNFCCLRAKMLQKLFGNTKKDISEIFYQQQLIYIDKILSNYKSNQDYRNHNKTQRVQIKYFIKYIILCDMVSFSQLVQRFDGTPTFEEIQETNKKLGINSINTRYFPKENLNKFQSVSRIYTKIYNFRAQNLINSFEIDQIIQKIEQVIIYIDLNLQIQDDNYNSGDVELLLKIKCTKIQERLQKFQYQEYSNLVDNFDYLNQISNVINIQDIQQLDKEQIKYCFNSIQNLCDFHLNYFLGVKRIICFQNLNEGKDVLMVISRLQSKLNQLNHYQRQALRSRQSYSKLSQYLNDFIQEQDLSQFKYVFDFESYLEKDKLLIMVKQLQKEIDQADKDEEPNDQICEQFVSIRSYLIQIQTKLNSILIQQPKNNQESQLIDQNKQQSKLEIKMQKLDSTKKNVENLIKIIETSYQNYFDFECKQTEKINLIKEVDPLFESSKDKEQAKIKNYVSYQYQVQSIKQASDRQLFQRYINRYIKQLKIIRNLIIMEKDPKKESTRNLPQSELNNLLEYLRGLKIQGNNFDDLLENSITDLNYYFNTTVDINNEDAIKPILLKIVKSLCKNRNYEQIQIQYKQAIESNGIAKALDKVDASISQLLVSISSTNKAIKIPTAYYIVMASQYKNTESTAIKFLTRLSVLETDGEVIEIFQSSEKLIKNFAAYWKQEEQSIEQILMDSIQQLKELQFQISTTNNEREKIQYQQEYANLEKEINQQIKQIDDLQKDPKFQIQALFLTQIKAEVTQLKDTLDKITQQLDFIMQDIAYLRGKSIEQLLQIRMNNVIQLKQINDIKCIFTPVKTKERNFVNKQDDPLTDLYEEIEEYFELDTMKTSMLIHGQAGSGKSTAARKIEELLWEKFCQVVSDKKTQTIPIVPILISLPSLKDPLSSAVEETLKSDLYRFNNKQINEFKEQVEQGKWRILFIFDSYDELKSNYLQTNILIKNRVSKWRKIGETQGFPKCITTSRTEIFKSSDYHEWFWSETKSFNNFKEIQLTPFNKEAVKSYLDLYTILKLRLTLIKYFQKLYIKDEYLAILKLKSFISKLSSLIFQNQNPGNLLSPNQANNIIQDLINQYSTVEKSANFENNRELLFVELTHIWNTQQYLFYINELKLLDILETPFIMELVVQVLPQIVEQSQKQRNLQQKFFHDYIRFKLQREKFDTDILQYEINGQKLWSQLESNENIFQFDQVQYDQQKLAVEIKNIFKKLEGDQYEMIMQSLGLQQINKFLFYEKFIDEYFEKQISKQRDLGETIDSELFKKELWQCGIHIAQNMLKEQITVLDYQPQGFLEQGGLKKVSSKQGWKYKFFDDNDVKQQQMKKLIRGCLPLKSRNQKYSFSHKSILEFLAAFDVIQMLDSIFSSFQQFKEAVQDHFINSTNFSNDFMKGMVGFIIEQMIMSTYIQIMLTQVVLLSCQDENCIIASSNAMFILNQIQFPFCKIKNMFNQTQANDLKNLRIRDVNLEGINLYKCNLDYSEFVNVRIHNCNLKQASFVNAQWINIESDCLYEKTFDVKNYHFQRFCAIPFICDMSVYLQQADVNQSQNDQKKGLQSQLQDFKYFKQLELPQEVNQVSILQNDEQNIWVITIKSLDLNVQTFGTVNNSYTYSPLYKCNKVFLPTAGSLFYYKKDLKLIIKHAYTATEFNKTPSFMILVDDDVDVLDILHPYTNMVIICQTNQEKIGVVIYRFNKDFKSYIKQMLVNGLFADIRFFDNHLSIVVEKVCVKVIKIDITQSHQELLNNAQKQKFQIPQSFDHQEQEYMNFIHQNTINIEQAQQKIEVQQAQIIQEKRDDNNVAKEEEKKEDKKEEKQAQSGQQLQQEQQNAYVWQIVFDTKNVINYKDYFIKDNFFYLVTKFVKVYDMKNSKLLYNLNISVDELQVYQLHDKVYLATREAIQQKNVLKIFQPSPDFLKQIQQKVVHAMSFDGLYLAYQQNFTIQVHKTKQFYSSPISINLSEAADMLGFCKLKSSLLYSFFLRSKSILIWNIHTLELIYSGVIQKIDIFKSIEFIKENYFEIYNGTNRFNFSLQNQQIIIPQLVENKRDLGNLQIEIIYSKEFVQLNISTQKIEVEKQITVNKNLEGDEMVIKKIVKSTNDDRWIKFKNEKISTDINDWYYFENLYFYILREGNLTYLIYKRFSEDKVFTGAALENIDRSQQLFILEQKDHYIFINGNGIQILKYSKGEDLKLIYYDDTPRCMIDCSVDQEYVYIFYKTFDFAIYKIENDEFINCYSTFKEINSEPLKWIK